MDNKTEANIDTAVEEMTEALETVIGGAWSWISCKFNEFQEKRQQKKEITDEYAQEDQP